PSTCPATRWPLSSLSIVRHRSRLIRSPALSVPKVERRRVSAERSAEIFPRPLATTVTQTPLKQIESPIWILLRGSAVFTVITAPCGTRLTLAMVPRSSIIPVYIAPSSHDPSCESAKQRSRKILSFRQMVKQPGAGLPDAPARGRRTRTRYHNEDLRQPGIPSVIWAG